MITVTGVRGGYPEETDGTSSWMWTDGRLEYRASGAGAASVRARFSCQPVSPRRLMVSVVDTDSRLLLTANLREGWNTVVSDPFEVTQPEFSLLLQSDQPPHLVAPSDPRALSFRIKDLTLSAAESKRLVLESVLAKLVCPVCLGALAESDKKGPCLVCSSCASVFLVESGFPILLLDDENRRIKTDEIRGEAEFNSKKVPPEVHRIRNAFVDRNTEIFLHEAGVSLAGKEVLAVGGSMAELLMCAHSGARPFGLDIVPNLTGACHLATVQAGVDAGWVCGDGECLPFREESFDVVMVRQALHHMLKYYSAIAEFFRVLRIGGEVLIVDEPFSAPDPGDFLMSYPDGYQLYGRLSIADVRKALGVASPSTPGTVASDLENLERARAYIAVDGSDPEQLLADKYHSFSLLNCISALKMHTSIYKLYWPREVGWADESGAVVEFRSGPSPLHGKPLLEKLVSQGNVSIAARKQRKSRVFRDRHGILAMPLDVVRTML